MITDDTNVYQSGGLGVAGSNPAAPTNSIAAPTGSIEPVRHSLKIPARSRRSNGTWPMVPAPGMDCESRHMPGRSREMAVHRPKTPARHSSIERSLPRLRRFLPACLKADLSWLGPQLTKGLPEQETVACDPVRSTMPPFQHRLPAGLGALQKKT